LDEIAREKGVDARDIEIWFADEARVGQKNKLTRRWAKRGSQPSAPKDQRTASTYIFGAISPKDGKGAALVLPKCDTYAMNLHVADDYGSLDWRSQPFGGSDKQVWIRLRMLDLIACHDSYQIRINIERSKIPRRGLQAATRRDCPRNACV
jgi:hypothetical protein